jgi:hypothetical protein
MAAILRGVGTHRVVGVARVFTFGFFRVNLGFFEVVVVP